MSTAVIDIPLTQGLLARIDADDFALVSRFKWHAAKNGHGMPYACACLGKAQAVEMGKRHIKMHRLLLGFPPGEIDHIDGDTLNNCRSNLRSATHTQNQANTSKRNAIAKTSRFKGVSWHRGSRQWQVFMKIDGRNAYLGAFKSEVEAAEHYDSIARKRFGKFARPNLPTECERRELNPQALTGISS